MVNNEQNNRTYRCNEDAAEIEGFNLSQTDETAKEAAQDATSYAYENRDKKASGILPCMMSFASAPAIKPKKNPG